MRPASRSATTSSATSTTWIFGANFADPTQGYAAYLDVDSAISYLLIEEMIRNLDGNLRLSTYLYKQRDGKLFFGPLWDFDLAIGNVTPGDPNYFGAELTDGWYVRLAPWFARMFQDPAFEAKVKARWAQRRPTDSSTAS